MNTKRSSKRFIVLAIALVAMLMAASAVLARGISPKPAFSLWDQSQAAQDDLLYEDGAFVILALDDDNPALTAQALVEQIHTFLGSCSQGNTGEEYSFATGPNDLFPPEGTIDCATPGLVNLHSAWVIMSPDGQGSALTEQALVEQMRTYLGGCDNGDTGEAYSFATGPDDLFPPQGTIDCPTIIRLPQMPQS
jgi:hypothetical protein